jgi:cell division protease FtsH
MVTQFGMSDAIGPMAVGDQEHEIFLGRELSQRREVSDQTAQLVDSEVKRILDSAYASAERVLTDNRVLLDSIANSLLERETLDADDIRLLEAGEPLPPLPPADGPTPAAALGSGTGSEESARGDVPLEGSGGEPAPALA